MESDKENSICLAWRNLQVSACMPVISSRVKPILRHVTGYIGYHTLTGILGPSGAGKTTLLKCISGDVPRGLHSTSELYLNPNETESPRIGFIGQQVHESMVSRMSVGEALQYAFGFKNPLSLRHQMCDHIKSILKLLLLDQSILERPFSQCSGGEQKRVAIAQELMSLNHLPTILILDEPTTGLDSCAASLLIDCLRRICAKHRMAIVLSIHLPSDRILSQFDQLYILARGGLQIYAGVSENLRETLKSELDLELDPAVPPIEEWMRIASYDPSDFRVRHLCQKTHVDQVDTLSPHILSTLDCLSHTLRPSPTPFSLFHLLLQHYRVGRIIFYHERHLLTAQITLTIIWFTLISMLFNPEMVMHWACVPFITSPEKNNSTVISSTNCVEGLRENAYIQSYFIFILFVLIFYQLSIQVIGALFVGSNLKVFQHEFRNGWYSFSVLFTSFTLIRLLEVVLLSTLTTLMVYFATDHIAADKGHIHWSRLFHFILLQLLLSIYLQSAGQIAGALFLGHIELSLLLSCLIGGMITMTNGFVISVEKMDKWALNTASELYGSLHISKALLYAFYGIDRCASGFRSLVLEEFSIDPETVYTGLWRPIGNTLFLRILTMAVLYFKFAHRRQVRLKATGGEISLSIIPLDQPDVYDNTAIQLDDIKGSPASTCFLSELTDYNSNKMRNSTEELQFCHNKLILVWRNLTLYTPQVRHQFLVDDLKQAKPESEILLRSLSGSLRFGCLTALVGTSGAGKTSLLKVLSGRFKSRLNGDAEFYLSRFTPISTCYLTQEVSIHLWNGLSVKQSLLYASRLKNASFGKLEVDHTAIVTRLLNELQLLDAADTLVQQCSGGERKRLALAQELTTLRMPNLICVDEPTSGLDSNSAFLVAKCLRSLVERNPITIVASVHQPSHEVLFQFHQVYALARGGVCIYSGSPDGITSHLTNLVSENHFRYSIEELIQYSGLSHTDSQVKELAQRTDCTVNKQVLSSETQLFEPGIPQNRIRFSLNSVWLLTTRQWIYFYRTAWTYWSLYMLVDLGFALSLRYFFDSRIALPSGCIDLEKSYNQTTCERSRETLDEQSDLLSNFRYSFFYSNNLLTVVIFQVALMFQNEWPQWRMEQCNGWYSTGALYLMHSLTELLLLLPAVLVYAYLGDIYAQVRPNFLANYTLLLSLSVVGMQPIGQWLALFCRGQVRFLVLLVATVATWFFLLGSQLFSPLGYRYAIFNHIAQFCIPRFLSDATMLLLYGFDRCRPNQEISGILFQIGIDPNHHAHHYYYCIMMLLFNAIFWRLVMLTTLLGKAKPEQIQKHITPRASKSEQRQISSLHALPGMSASFNELRIRQIRI